MSKSAQILRFFLSPIPRRVMRCLGKPLGFLWWSVFRFRRKIVLDNLTKAFPDWSLEKKKEVGRKSVYMLAENFFEFFLIPAIDEKWLEKNVTFQGLENLDKAIEGGKGALLLCLHIANGDVLASCVARRGYKISIITKFFNSQLMNSIWFGIRGAQGVKWIPPHGEKTPFMILKAIKNQEFVAFVLDQHMGRPYGIETKFFGQPAGTAYGLALFQLKTKRPVIPIYSYSGEDGKIHIIAEPAFLYDPQLESKDRDQTLVELTQAYTDKIEEIVRRYPGQWMWVHRRWKWKGSKLEN